MVQKRAFQLMRELERCANGGKEVNLAEWTQAFACVFSLYLSLNFQ